MILSFIWRVIIMSEFKEIDLSQLQKVWVRVQSDGSWKQRWLAKILDRDDCRYLCFNENFDSTTWRHCRPYKEPTKRPMTNREIFNALKKEDCWLRDAEKSMEFNTYDTLTHKSFYEITYDGGETWHKLEVEK